MAAYAQQLADNDTGWWRKAVRHAAQWISPHHTVINLDRQIPMPQLMLQATALLVYALARSRDADPCSITAGEVLDWVNARQLPAPPEPAGTAGIDFAAQVRLWRHEVDHAAGRQQDDLAALLRVAGHTVPEPGHRGLDRFSPDPVIATWLGLVDNDAASDSMMDQFPAPLLSIGLSTVDDLG